MKVAGIGGTAGGTSTADKLLCETMKRFEAAGCTTDCLFGAAIDLPVYRPGVTGRTAVALRFVETIRNCDALVIVSPVYHGGMSGLIKNALDYVEDLHDDDRPYFSLRPVGLMATGAGWQGAVGALTPLRAMVHALRGWPSPLGVAVNTREANFEDGGRVSARLDQQLDIMTAELIGFAQAVKGSRLGLATLGKIQT